MSNTNECTITLNADMQKILIQSLIANPTFISVLADKLFEDPEAIKSLALGVDVGEVAQCINLSNLYDQISVGDIADEVCIDSVVERLNYKELAKCLLMEVRL